jgi:hypothetical protein
MGRVNAGWRREILKPSCHLIQDVVAQPCIRHGLRAIGLHHLVTRCTPLLCGYAAEHGVNRVHGEVREDLLHRIERAGVLELLNVLHRWRRHDCTHQTRRGSGKGKHMPACLPACLHEENGSFTDLVVTR